LKGVLDARRSELVSHAAGVRRNAHAPYSNFRVGAALRTPSGAVYAGCNVENASYGATLCAERAAVAAMVAAGEREVEGIAVYTEADPPAMPCGICRQVLLEFGSERTLILSASPKEVIESTLGEILPSPFTLSR
jgi:cytidine deaminase